MDVTMMACGHASNAIDGRGNPSCAICFCSEPAPTTAPDPTPSGRRAKCSYPRPGRYYPNGTTIYGKSVDGDDPHGPNGSTSKTSLPFFKSEPEKEFDSFYCGCWGWD